MLSKLLFLLLTMGIADAAIYGLDDRKDINQMPQFREIARSVAIAVPGNYLVQKPSGRFEVTDVELLGNPSGVNACPSERFVNQPSIGNCTGFLISDRLLVTAGHCIIPTGVVNNDSDHPYCKSFKWVFDFNVNSAGKTSEGDLPADKVYGCKRVVRAENIELNPSHPGRESGNDFAILELDRPVSKTWKPLKLSLAPVKVGAVISTLGHQSGLPLKFSGYSKVLRSSNLYSFEANLDTLSGNSGGPVFDKAQNVVGILVSGHPIDYVMTTRGCFKPNSCSADGKTCLEESTFGDLPRSNFAQRLNALLPFIRK